MSNFQNMPDFQKNAKFSTKKPNFQQQKMPKRPENKKSQIIPETSKMPYFPTMPDLQKNANYF